MIYTEPSKLLTVGEILFKWIGWKADLFFTKVCLFKSFFRLHKTTVSCACHFNLFIYCLSK